MKGLVIAIVLGVALNLTPLTAGADSCPAENGPVDVLLPHESDCGKFYKCNAGEKVEQDCPAGLHFNPEANYCDWPENVNCQHNSDDESKPPVVEEPQEEDEHEDDDNNGPVENNGCPAENGPVDVLLPHESDCGKFYKCHLGEKVEHSCGQGLLYNPERQYCDWPENVKCGQNTGNNNVIAPVDSENTCPAEDPAEDVLFPHESDCGKFYKCNGGQKIEQDCPDGLHFNPAANYCDWPENANCNL